MRKALFATPILVFTFIAVVGLQGGTRPESAHAPRTTSLNPSPMTIEIWSDIVCPFCYIGKTQLDRALRQFAHREDVIIVRKSFQLMPELPEHATSNIYEVLAEKYDISIDEARQMNDQVSARAKAEGLTFNIDQSVLANTSRAHQLIHYAKPFHKDAEVEQALFKAYFTEGKNINDLETLVSIGESAELSASAIRAMLEEGDYLSVVQADQREAQEKGVRGVPHLIFNHQFAISGAQGSDAFLNALERTFETMR
jgi:protein disulfide-isomerase